MNSLRGDMAQMDDLVCRTTDISPEDLNELRFNAAYEYLEQIIGTDTYGLEQIPRTSEFWAHWRLLWLRIDQQIYFGGDDCPAIITDQDPDTARRLYLAYHEQNDRQYQLNSTLIDTAWHEYTKTLQKR